MLENGTNGFNTNAYNVSMYTLYQQNSFAFCLSMYTKFTHKDVTAFSSTCFSSFTFPLLFSLPFFIYHSILCVFGSFSHIACTISVYVCIRFCIIFFLCITKSNCLNAGMSFSFSLCLSLCVYFYVNVFFHSIVFIVG